MDETAIFVDEEFSGQRLDKFLGDTTDYSRSFIQKLCSQGNITDKSGKVLSQKYKVKTGDVLMLNVPEPESLDVVPEEIPLDIVYEDRELLVLNKPQGMVVHPAPGNLSGTLVNALMYHCREELSGIGGVKRPGIVHRIDKDTSGLLVIAKTDDAHISLTSQWSEKKPERKYIALVNENIKEDFGTIDKPIARSPKDRKKMAIVSGGREAVTHFRVLERFSGYTLIECTLETGRTHQIRVHMKSLGHSIVGDPVYGIKKEKFNLRGQLLHAKTLGFVHPVTGEHMIFESELPTHFQEILDILRKNQQNN